MRRLFNFAAAVSLLLFVATMLAALRSFNVGEMFLISRTAIAGSNFEEKQWEAQVASGFVVVSLHSTAGAVNPAARLPRNRADGITHVWHQSGAALAYPASMPMRTMLGFHYDRHSTVARILNGATLQYTHGVIAIPMWFMGAITAVLPFLWFWKNPGKLRRNRMARNLCITCGYDLRASPERCPECGRAVAGGVAAVADNARATGG